MMLEGVWLQPSSKSDSVSSIVQSSDKLVLVTDNGTMAAEVKGITLLTAGSKTDNVLVMDPSLGTDTEADCFAPPGPVA